MRVSERLSENFSVDEFRCPCCGKIEMYIGFIRKLQMARSIAGIPFIINSGFRCDAHNAAVGGSKSSSHEVGLAADIRVASSSERFAVIFGLIRAGFTRIGVGKNFIHADSDQAKSQRIMWRY